MLRRGGSCFRFEHLLLCGIPYLETIKQEQINSASKPSNQQTSGTKSSSTKCFQQTRICLVILFPIFNLIFHIFFPSDVDCIPSKLIKIFNPFMVIVNFGLFLYRDLHGIKYKLYFASMMFLLLISKLFFGHEIKFTPCQSLWFIDKKFTA
jgi:hypothetical protein